MESVLPCYYGQVIQNNGTKDIFNGRNTNKVGKLCPRSLWKIATRKLDQLDSVANVEELRIPLGNMLEALKGDRKNEFSVRINDQYRICFTWSETGADHVGILDFH